MPKPEDLLKAVESAVAEGEVVIPPEVAERMAKVNNLLLRGTTDLTEIAQLMPSERAKLAQVGKLKEDGLAKANLLQVPGLERGRDEPNR